MELNQSPVGKPGFPEEPGQRLAAAPAPPSHESPHEPLPERMAALEAALAHREREIAAMRQISDALFHGASLDDLVRNMLKVAIRLVDGEVGSVQLYNPEDDTLVFRYVEDPFSPDLVGFARPTTLGISGRVFRTGIPDITRQARERAEFYAAVDERTGYHTESMITVPVQGFEGPPIGVMQVLNMKREFDHHDLEVMEVLCAQAATAIQNARAAEEAHRRQLIYILGKVSHDIKNMMTPIQGGAMLLRPDLKLMLSKLKSLSDGEGASEDLRQAIQAAVATVEHCYEPVLQSILDCAERVKALNQEIASAVKGEMTPPQLEELDLNETARSLADVFRPSAEEAGIDLALDLDPALPRAPLDSRQLDSALYNLIINALAETPRGGKITIRTRAPQGGGRMLLVEVEDTGRGMPLEVIQRIQRGDMITTKADGTGLGTLIVDGVVRRHRGSISIRSQPGAGTTFSIQLPVQPL